MTGLPFVYWIGVAVALGGIIGSFLNVVIYRLPNDESLVSPGSRCPSCEHAIRPWHNIPVLGWLLLRGRCADCGVWISPRYPAVEALTALLFALAVWRFGVSGEAAIAVSFSAALIAAAGIDFDHRIIPDEISVGGLVVGLSVVPALRTLAGQGFVDAWVFSALGALLGGGLLWIVGFVHARLSALQGRRFPHWPEEDGAYPTPKELDYWVWFPGMGFGDVKLLAMIGTVVGPSGILPCVIAASALGLIFGLAYGLATRSMSAPFGFGPALAAGALVALLVPEFRF